MFRRPVYLLLVLVSACAAAAADVPSGDYEAHELSLWVAEPGLPLVNPRQYCPSALPGSVGSSRRKGAEGPKRQLAPLALLTFHGQPLELLDVDLRVAQGRFTGCWPGADLRSARIRWLDAKLVPPPADGEGLEPLAAEHWLQDVRTLAGLYVRRSRAEGCLAYEAELSSSLPVLVEYAGEQLKIANFSSQTLEDVFVVVRADDGIRVARLDKLEPSQGLAQMQAAASAAKGAQQSQAAVAAIGNLVARLANAPQPAPAPQPATAANDPPPLPTLPGDAVALSLSPPLAAGSAELRDQTSAVLGQQLEGVGLTAAEARFLVDRYETALFEPARVNVVARLARAAIDQQAPLALDPEPKRLVRAAILLVRDIDPRLRDSVEQLVGRLGDAEYAQREAAERRLLELGQMTIPALRKAVDNPDAEISMRAERILAELSGEGAAPPQAGGGFF